MSTSYDVVVIGGGIHGAGAAQAAAADGFSVLVLEQNALASGTSCKSSKLIHGGLRYLESGQFNLVRECLHERTLLLKLAPDLVKLSPFYIPVYPDTTRRAWQVRSGLSIYAALGGLIEDARFKIIPKHRWESLDGLCTLGLEKVFCYYDAQTDDAALTHAVMRSAQSLGTVLEMPAELISATRTDDGYAIQYKKGDQEHECRAKFVINASGPWANHVLKRISPKIQRLDVDLIQGTHIILEGRVSQGIYYLEAQQDKRAVFIMPWKDKLMVGTTETLYKGNPADVAPLDEEIDYLCEVLAHYFPHYRNITSDDVESSFAGLRVLPRTAGTAFSRPRDTIFHTDDPDNPRLVTIYGGKLTAYRATSERLMNQFRPMMPPRQAVADTSTLLLTP
ncbi:glycerol-3-phosphate dehydrogenase/oxidase [Pseudomonadota bacterium]